MNKAQSILHYESRSMSLNDRIESYERQVKEADKVITKNQEWKEHSQSQIRKAQNDLILVAEKLRELKA